jgi:hypothetical protein
MLPAQRAIYSGIGETLSDMQFAEHSQAGDHIMLNENDIS